jgi:tRNA modification GTPase
MGRPATIAAIASPPGAGVRGVIRVSGPEAWEVIRAVWVAVDSMPIKDRRGFYQGRFDDGLGTQPLLLLWMPGPRSFTRDDVAEFHLPGSPPLLAAALGRILSMRVRPAEPGEFTRRAFENGRIDLTRAEGILELVHARNEAERRSATALLLGGLADRLAPLRDGLAALRALAEASLDFDEADTGHVPEEELMAMGNGLLDGLHEAARWEARRSRASDLPLVALVGAPNAGKSSLFNSLVGEGSALVSDFSGTTRDVLVGTWKLGQGSLRLADTAGLDRRAEGPDAEAQRMGRRYLESADLQLWLVDPEGMDRDALRAQWGALPEAPQRLLVWTKADRENLEVPDLDLEGLALLGTVRHSSADGRGAQDLEKAVEAAIFGQAGVAPRASLGGREIGVRHRLALEKAAGALQGGLGAFQLGLPLDQFAHALRVAGVELDGIHGRTTAEDLLTRIFSSFCIGK